MVGVLERGKLRKAALAAAVPAGRKRREPVLQPVVRPDLRGAVTASIRDVVAYSGISRSSLWKLEKEGRLKVERIGRTVLVRIDSVHDVLGGPPANRAGV